MTPDEYHIVCETFQQAIALPPDVREEWLARQLHHRPGIKAEVCRMLAADEHTLLYVSPVHSHLAGSDQTVPFNGTSSADLRDRRTLAEPLPKLPGYELLDELGRGGMGVVFKARQLSPERTVAVKMILTGQFASQQEIQRFRAEAEAAANLSHAGIVPIYEVGHHQGRHFFSMGYIEGQSLAETIRRENRTPEQIADLVLAIAEAMAHAHAAGIVHRDLKPSNILIDPDGKPRVTDFGLAKRLNVQSDVTYSGQILGSPGYMAPEQAAGRNDQVSEATDIYGLGAILYALLTGKPPFQADNLLDAIDQICTTNPVPPRKRNRQCPAPLETICLKCLHKTPGARYSSMKDLAADLRAFLQHEPIRARPLSLGERTIYWARRKPGLASTWAAVLLFFAYHLVSSYGVREQISAQPWFRGAAIGFALAFAGGAWFFQRMYEKPSRRQWAIYGWMTWNFLLLTGLLFLNTGAASPLSLIYLLLIAASATLYEKGVVGYTMALATTGYVMHVIAGATVRPAAAVDFHQAACFLLSILVLGMIQYFVVRRIRRTMEACD